MQDGEELRSALLRRVPAKIDIGPIYNVDPQRRTAYAGERWLLICHVQHARQLRHEQIDKAGAMMNPSPAASGFRHAGLMTRMAASESQHFLARCWMDSLQRIT